MGGRDDGIWRQWSAPVEWIPQRHGSRRLRREKMNAVRSFPHDLVISIMSRLPVKSLLRFKSVSKPWANSIDDPSFIKSHAKQPKNSRLVVGLKARDWETGLGGIEYYSIAIDSPQNLVREDFPELPKHTIFIGSCNGLVCLLSYKGDNKGYREVVDIFVWNIATKEYRIIPNPATTHKYSKYCFGFGYDSVHDDYKVLRLGGPCGSRMDSKFTSYETQFYSVRHGVWSAVKVYPTSSFDILLFPQVLDECLVYINNALHTSARRHKDEDYSFVLAIDLVTEEFREISFPKWLYGVWFEAIGGCLEAIGGCLGVTCFNGTWVMKDYGVEESWTKLPLPDDVNFALGEVSESLRHNSCSWAACFPEMDGTYQVYYSLDGHCHRQLFWYDMNKGEFEEIVKARWSFPLMTMQQHMYNKTGAVICAQTLVSLKTT